MYLHQLQAVTMGTLIGDVAFEGVAADLAKVKEGDLFVCIRGIHFDTHTVAHEAVAKGAVAVVCEHVLPLDAPQLVVGDTRAALSRIAAHFYRVDHGPLVLVGVTGTNGKTSTAFMLQRIFSAAGHSAAYVGTLGVVADKLLLPPTLTTPDPLELMPLLASLTSRGVRYVFLEVSAHAAALRKVAGLHFGAMVFTNLTQDHLDYFEDMATYANAKLQLFDNAVASLGVVNADDELGRKIMAARRLPLLTYGLDNPADVFAVRVKDDREGLSFVVNAFDVLLDVATDLHGIFNVYNVLAATTVCGYYGVDLRNVRAALRHIFIPGRFNIIDVGGVRFIVDYAHTPDGLQRSLQAARTQTKGKLTVVFGCGGERDTGKRAQMGRVAGEGADYVFITNDNPRSESPMAIAQGIEAGVGAFDNYSVVLDRAEAIREAYRTSREGDVVLIAGKGAETSMEIGGERKPYSDYDVIEGLR